MSAAWTLPVSSRARRAASVFWVAIMAWMKSSAHRFTSYRRRRSCNSLLRRTCSSTGMVSACSSACAKSSWWNGLMMSASPISLAAPAISLKIKTPVWSGREAMNSLATRFIPSRNGVMSATSQPR